MLRDFISLASKPDADIEGFAREFGVLRLCQRHNKPLEHDASCVPSQSEPLIIWRDRAREANAIVRLAVSLRRPVDLSDSLPAWNQLGPVEQRTRLISTFGQTEHWALLEDLHRTRPLSAASKSTIRRRHKLEERLAGQFFGGGPYPPYPKTGTKTTWDGARAACIAQQEWARKMLVARLRGNWLDSSRVALDLSWTGEDPQIQYRVGSLSTGLSLELLVAVLGTTTIATCSACLEVFSPWRQPRAGEETYCEKPACKAIGAARRQAKRRKAKNDPSNIAQSSGIKRVR